MKLSRFVTALSAASLFATMGVAQTPEELKKEIDGLRAQVTELMSDKGAAAREESVETEVNRLSERLAAGTTVNSGASKVTLAGEFRYRGYLTLGDTSSTTDHDGWFNSTRVRLGFGYEFSKDVSAYAELQSSFSFGHNGHTSEIGSAGNTMGPPGSGVPGSETVHLCQAWVKTANLFGRPEFSMKIGRQSVTLGNQFQFGNADWYEGVFFDGVRYEWDSDSFRLTGLWLRLSTNDANDSNQSTAFNQQHNHDELYSVYFTLKTIKNHELDLYWIYSNLHTGFAVDSGVGGPSALAPAATDYFHTLGARIGGTVDVACGLDWNLEAAYQFGTEPTPTTDISALTIEGEVGVTFNKDNKFRAYLRGLFAEGADSGDLAYAPLYPNRHSNTAKFRARYGIFDIFPMTDVFALTGGVHFDPAADWTVGLNGVWGQRDSDVTGQDDTYGFEIDLWAEYRYSEALTFGVGAALLFPDDQIENGFADGNVLDGTQFLLYMQARLFF